MKHAINSQSVDSSSVLPVTDGLYLITAAAKYLGISLRMLQYHVRDGIAPPYEVVLGGRNLKVFRRGELDAWKAARPTDRLKPGPRASKRQRKGM